MYVSMEDSKFCEKINKDVEVFDLFQNDFEDLDKSSSDWWREDQASEFSASVSSETNNCNIERVECKSPIFKTPYSEPRTRKQKKSFTSISSNSSSKKRRRVASPESSETSALEMDWYSPYKFSKLSPVVPLQVESGTIPESLEALLEEGSDVSWSSTFATPLASNATLSNLNSNEKKVFIPSNELKKPRVLFSPDKDVDFTECYQLMDTSGDTSQANISDITVLAENSNIYKTVSPVTSKKNMSVSRCSTVTEDLFDTSLSSNNGNVQNSEGNSCVPIVLEQTTVLTSSFERTAEIQIAPVEHSIEGENISDNSTKCSVLCNMSKKNNLSKSCDSGVNESTEISVVDNFSPVRDVTSMSVSVSRKLFGSGKDEKPSEVFAAHNETVPAIEQDSGAVTCDVSDRKFSSTVESIKHPQLISVTSADSLNETASRGHTTQDFPQDLSFSTLEEICQITELLAASTDMPVECSQDERRENKAIKTPVCIKFTPKCSRLCRTSTPFTRTERHFSVDSGKKKKKIKFVCDTENEHLNSECVEHNEVSNDLRQDGEELGQRLHESDAIKKQNSAEQKFPPKNASDIASRVQSIRDSVNQSKKFSYLSSGMQIAADILENKSSDSVADDVMKSARLFEQALMRTKSNTKKLDLSSNAKQEFIPFCKLKDNCPVTDCSSVPDPEMKTEDINLCTSEKTKRTTAVQNGTDTNISTVCSHFCEEVKTDSMTDSFNISEIESLCNVEEKCTSKLTCEALVPEVFGKELENDFYPKERELESSSLCKSASIQGFKTASGNQIKVSKESICKAMKFMDDIITGEKSHSSVDMTSAHEKNLSFNEQCDKSDFTSKSLITADKSVVPKFIEDHSVSFHEVNDGCLRSSNQIIPMHENNASHWSDNGTLEKNNDQENMVTDSQMILAVEHAEMMQQLVGDETIFSELPEETEDCGNKLFRKKNTSERGDRTEEPAGDKKFWYPPGKCEIVPENMEVSVTQCNIENQLKHLPEQYLQGEKQLYKKDVESSSFVRKEDEFKTCNLMQGADSSAVLECVNDIKPSNEEVDMEALLNSTVIGQLFSDNLHAFKTESTAQEAVLKSKNSLNPDHDMLATSKSEMQIQQPDLSGFYTANKKRSLISDCSPQRANEISEFEAESAYLKNRTSISSEETSENISESDSKIEHEKTAKYSTISEEKNWLLGTAMKLFPGDENYSKKFKNTSANLLTVKGGSNNEVNSVNQYSQLESARLSGNMLPTILEKNEIAEISKNISQTTENSLDHVTVSVVKDLTAADVKKTSTSPKTFKSAQHMISEIDAHVSSGTENLSKIQIQHTESEFTINNSFNGEQSLYLNRGSEFVDGSETADISHANGRKVSVSALNSESKAELLKSKGNNEKINLAFHKHLVRPINRKTVSESATITKECLELMGSKEDLPVFRDFPEKLDSPNLRGFSTASGKKVSVSTKALIRAQKLFAEETQNKKSVSSVTEASELKEMDRSSSTIFKEFSAESDKVSASTKGLSKAKKMFAEENHSMKMVIGTDVTESSVLRGLENPYSPIFKGFSTASGKRVAVSVNAFNRAKKLFLEENFCVTAIGSEAGTSEMKQQQEHSSPVLNGFRTAIGKEGLVPISTLERAKEDLYIKEVGSETSEMKQQHILPNLKGFSTANGKKICVSDEALQRAKELFEEENPFMKPVADLAKPSDLRELGGLCSTIPKEFSTANQNRVSVSVETLNRTKKLLTEENHSTKPVSCAAVSSELKERGSCSPVLQGFSTASGKKVSLSAKALNEAQKLFLGEDSCIKEVGIEAEMRNEHNSPILKGFSTASGKKVPVSAEALSKAKKLFSEEDSCIESVCTEVELSKMRNKHSSPISKRFSTSRKKVSVSAKALSKAKKSLLEEDSCLRTVDETKTTEMKENTEHNSPILKGFSTASGKKVSVSAKALNRVKKLFSDEEYTKTITSVAESSELNKQEGPHSPVLQRFSTASGKKVPVSAKNLSKVKKLFSDEKEYMEPVTNVAESSEKGQERPCSPILQEFSTASGKKVSVSAKALSRVKELFAEENEPSSPVAESSELKEQKRPYSPVLQGFSTASGKKVSVSAKALSRAKELFAEENEPDITVAESSGLKKQERPYSPVLQGFSTASGKKVSVSAKALSRVKELLVEENEPGFTVAESSGLKEQERPYSPVLQGFSTASGKKVSVSAKALSRVKELFAEENEPDITVAESSGLKEQERPYSPVLQGFSTASGKKVSVSAKALSRVKELFAEENEPCNTIAESSGLKEQERPYSPVLQGFSTASGKKVSVSAKALSRVKELFAEENKYIKPVRNVPESSELKEQEIPCSPVLGFSTASGKKVSVSSQALSRVKKLFAEENDVAESSNLKEQEGLCSPLLQGCSVENGKNVSVATKSLCAAKKLFLEEDCPMKAVDTGVEMLEMKDKNNSLILKGFSTASGKKVSVTENSLVRAKQLFLEDSSIQGIDMESVVPIPQIISTTGTRRVSVNSDKCVTDVKFQKSNEPTSVSKPSENVRSSVVRRKSSTGKLRLSRSEKVSSRSTSALCASYQASENSAVLPVLLSREKMNEHAKEECEHKESKFTSQEQDNLNPTSRTSLSRAAMDIQMRDNTDLRVPKGMNLPMSLTQEVQESAAALLADEAALDSPGWVASYVSCPDMLHDRVAAPSAMVSSEVNDAEAAAVTEPGSPVLGSCERGRKNKRSRLSQKSLGVNLEQKTHTTSSSFKVPYKKTTNTAEKMSSSSHISAPKQTRRHLEFGTPFRKHFPLMEQNGWSVSHEKRERSGREKREVCSEVVTGRQTAADEQEALVRRRTNTGVTDLLPCTGSYYVRKQERHTQMTWREAVNGTLPGRYTRSQLLKFGIKEFVLDISAENSVEFRFSAWDYYSRSVCEDNVKGLLVGDGAHLILDAKGTAGVEEVTRAFLSSPGIEPALVPSGWVRNHYRWLVWKLAAIERSFPQQFSNRCLTPNVLLLQLKYRYDREIDHCERPAIRKILEHDDTAAKRLVLCVARIVKLEKAETDLCFELELTDGWYGLNAVVDQEMCHRIRRGTIAVGTKLISHGAELLNCEQGCSPLEVGSEVKLKLHSNSTRRARWDTKLGFHSKPGPLRIPLTSVLSAGGMISCVSVMVVRVYPTLYVEKLADGRSVIRSLRAEEQAALHWERSRQACVELLFSQVKGELLREDAKKKQQIHRNQIPRAQELSLICSGEKLCNILELAPDPASIEALLNEEQRLIVADYQRLKCEKMQLELQTRVTEKLGETTATVRNVALLFKVRCVDISATKPSKSAMLSVWRPSEDVIHMLKEGSTVTLFNVSAAGTRGGDLQLSAGRQTVYRPSSHQNNCIFKRRVTSFGEVTSSDFCPQFGELDVVGMVVFIGDAPQGTSGFQVVYLADVASNILGMAFWGGVKQFGWEELLKPRTVVAASNLQWRHGAAIRWVPCAYVSELSCFSTNPRQPHLQEALTSFTQEIRNKDVHLFSSACEEKVSLLLRSSSLVPGLIPKRSNAQFSADSPHNGSKEGGRNQHSNGLLVPNIRGTVNSCTTIISHAVNSVTDPSTKAASSSLERRIQKLQQYGEPPPLSPLILAPLRPSVKKEFHTPVKKECPVDADNSPPLSLDSDPG
ncbi:breast cancer type 2 susceptibility protein homolog isoform X2 [Periplaneta americana]|uniref:breast cancer type 2 susceptibility protein homolog isoform X2 n=1 Tax=Periplaneta americana TaxID=6978 RepID=UPI0037E7A692